MLHDGYEHMARDIDAACPGTYDKVLEFIRLCRRVYDSMDVISVTPMSKLRMLREHPDFVRVAGYSASEVIRTFDLPQKAVDMLTPYWIYVGEPMDNLPFTIYAYCMADYFAGSYVPRHRSHEMSMRMQQKVEENGRAVRAAAGSRKDPRQRRQGPRRAHEARRRDRLRLCHLRRVPEPRLHADDRATERSARRCHPVRQRQPPECLPRVGSCSFSRARPRKTASRTTTPSPATRWTRTPSGATTAT